MPPSTMAMELRERLSWKAGEPMGTGREGAGRTRPPTPGVGVARVEDWAELVVLGEDAPERVAEEDPERVTTAGEDRQRSATMEDRKKGLAGGPEVEAPPRDPPPPPPSMVGLPGVGAPRPSTLTLLPERAKKWASIVESERRGEEEPPRAAVGVEGESRVGEKAPSFPFPCRVEFPSRKLIANFGCMWGAEETGHAPKRKWGQ